MHMKLQNHCISNLLDALCQWYHTQNAQAVQSTNYLQKRYACCHQIHSSGKSCTYCVFPELCINIIYKQQPLFPESKEEW